MGDPDELSERRVQRYISGRVWEMMKKHELTQEKLGRCIGLTHDVVSHRLSNRSRWTVQELIRMARLWRIPVEYFLPDYRR
jgi:transcriptional regulator with XRE-family HTH domain